MIFVEETFAREDEPTVRTPVDVEIVKRALPVAFPARFANMSWPLRAVLVIPPEVEVTYLLPFASNKLLPVIWI